MGRGPYAWSPPATSRAGWPTSSWRRAEHAPRRPRRAPIAFLGSAWAGSTLLSGTVTCQPGGGGRFDLTGGSFAINANGSLSFKMTGLPPNLEYGCVLNCGTTAVALLPGCGATNGVGKTAINLPAFFPPATFCFDPAFVIEFVGGELLCISGFGTNAAFDED